MVELVSPSGHSAYYTDHDYITLSESPNGKKSTHLLFHPPEGDRVTFDCLIVDFPHHDERMILLDAALEAMSEELYGNNLTSRELLLKASGLLRKGSRADRVELANLIDQYLKEGG